MATTYVREPKGTDPASAIRKIRIISKTKQAKKNFSVCQEKANFNARSTDRSF